MIELRPPTADDAAELAAAVSESLGELRPWMEWASPDYGVDQARAWIERSLLYRERHAAYEFVFTDGERILGVCGLNRISAVDRLANLGYWIRTSAAGRGITAGVVRRLAGWAFSHTMLHRLEIVVAVENHRSQRVAEKAGAVREGVLTSRLWLHEVPHDAVLYAMVRLAAPGTG